MLAALGMPSCLTLYFVSHPVPALGTHSGMPGTPFCCLGYRLSHPKSSLMSPYCPALLEHNVLPLPSHPASFLPWLYLGLSMVFTSKPFHPFSGSKKGQQIRDLQTPTVEEGFLLHTSCFHRLSHPTQVLGECPGYWAFPSGSVVKNPLANARDAGDTGLILGSGRSPGGGNGNPLVFLPGEPHGQRSLVGYSP